MNVHLVTVAGFLRLPLGVAAQEVPLQLRTVQVAAGDGLAVIPELHLIDGLLLQLGQVIAVLPAGDLQNHGPGRSCREGDASKGPAQVGGVLVDGVAA